MSRSHLLFSKYRKTWIFSILEPILVSIGDDKKINDMVIKDNVSTKWIKNENPKVKVTKISIFKNG